MRWLGIRPLDFNPFCQDTLRVYHLSIFHRTKKFSESPPKCSSAMGDTKKIFFPKS